METALPVPRWHNRASPAALAFLLRDGFWRERVKQMACGMLQPKSQTTTGPKPYLGSPVRRTGLMAALRERSPSSGIRE